VVWAKSRTPAWSSRDFTHHTSVVTPLTYPRDVHAAATPDAAPCKVTNITYPSDGAPSRHPLAEFQ
jgi:hypothetical protein